MGERWGDAGEPVAKADRTMFTPPAAPQEETVPKLKLLTEKTDRAVQKRPKNQAVPGSVPAVLLLMVAAAAVSLAGRWGCTQSPTATSRHTGTSKAPVLPHKPPQG